MSKLLKKGLRQNHKVLNALIICFILMIMISTFTSANPTETFKSLLIPYLGFIVATYVVIMVIPRIIFKQKITDRLEHDQLTSEELNHVQSIEDIVYISEHYIMHIPSQTIINIDKIDKIIIKANRQITSLMFIGKNKKGHTIMLKTGIVDEVINYLNDPSIQDHHIELEKYHDENIKEQFDLVSVIIILTLIVLGVLIAVHFKI